MFRYFIITLLIGLSYSTSAAEIPDFIKVGHKYLTKGIGAQLIEVIQIDHDWLYIKVYPEDENNPRYAWIHIHSDLLQAVIACDDKNLEDELKIDC